MKIVNTIILCTVWAKPSDGMYFMFQDRPNDQIVISFSQPVSAFGAYWGSGVNCPDCCPFDDAATDLTFEDVNGNVIGTDSFFYQGDGPLMWRGYTFGTPVKTITRTASDGKEGVGMDGLQAVVANGSPTPTPTTTPTPTPTPTPVATPAISVSVSPTTVNEGSDATFTISASTINPSQATTVQYAMSGKAQFGVDYTVAGVFGQADIPAGASSTTVVLHAVTDMVSEKNEKATMKLSPGTGYKVTKPKKATLTIINVP